MEIFFGRHSKLSGVSSNKYKWDKNRYDNISAICCAFTNIHVNIAPLHAADGDSYPNYRKRLYSFHYQGQSKKNISSIPCTMTPNSTKRSRLSALLCEECFQFG